jgi:pyrimidine deaminase RibD-like protein
MRAREFLSEAKKQADLMAVLRDFLPYAMKELKIDKLPPIKLELKINDENQPTFGKFVNDEGVIYLAIEDRHPLDIVRTLAHELVHYKQGVEHRLGPRSGETGSAEENQAHEIAGVIMRHFNKASRQYFDEPAVNLRESSEEIHNYPKLDKMLHKLCAMVVKGQKIDKEKYGMVAACVLDSENRMVAGLNMPGPNGTRRHAERVAIDNYKAQHGAIPDGSIVITTCSPCSEHMDERYQESCTELLNKVGITKVYCGFRDPTQPEDDREFDIMETSDKGLRQECQNFAETFLEYEHDQATENFADGKNPGRKGLAKRSGVNTKASISSLRNTAKHSSGEKARMAHWLANMKSGRKKHASK